MPEALPTFTGTVLLRLSRGESHLGLQVASPELGLQHILVRHSKRSPAPPDLFDRGEFMVERSQTGGQFLKDFKLDQRRTELAKSYDAFQYACEFAKLFRKNLQHFEIPAEPVALLERALDAFMGGRRPDVTLFKSLYLLARMEGFPVKEDWLQNQASTQRNKVISVLNNPLDKQVESNEVIQQLLKSLRGWLKGVDFVL